MTEEEGLSGDEGREDVSVGLSGDEGLDEEEELKEP